MSKRGGPRKNTGLVQSLELTKEQWRRVRTICLLRFSKANKPEVNKFFANYVEQEWQALNEKIERQADELAEVEPCVKN